MFANVDFTKFEPHIDFAYTTLLMIWGGSLVGIGMLTIPFIFKHFDSRDEASRLTTKILRKQDMLIRVVAISMLFVFYFKSRLPYTYQNFERFMYVFILHFFILGKMASGRLLKLHGKIGSFDTVSADEHALKRFGFLHRVVRYLYIGQFVGVVILLYLHAFGL